MAILRICTNSLIITHQSCVEQGREKKPKKNFRLTDDLPLNASPHAHSPPRTSRRFETALGSSVMIVYERTIELPYIQNPHFPPPISPKPIQSKASVPSQSSPALPCPSSTFPLLPSTSWPLHPVPSSCVAKMVRGRRRVSLETSIFFERICLFEALCFCVVMLMVIWVSEES